MRLLRHVLCLLCLLAPLSVQAQTLMPRVILGLYDGSQEVTPRQTDIHRLLEMPANHLGYDVRYHEVNQPLPKLNEQIAAVLIWLNPSVEVAQPKAYLTWLKQEVLGKGKRLIVVGSLGIGQDFRKSPGGMAMVNSVMAPLGLVDENNWVDLVYSASVDQADEAMMDFERPVGIQMSPYHYMRSVGSGSARVHLSIANPKEHKKPADLIVTNAHGGYVADQYALYRKQSATGGLKVQQWLMNPFEFLRAALDSDALPKPDVTTLAGNRIFYSHIDGDGWNNLTKVKPYKGGGTIAAEVLYKEVLVANQDLPFTVAPITSDLNPKCYGVKQSAETARKIFAMPNVEPATHTHSHILLWEYFANGDPARERELLDFYPPRPLANLTFWEFIKSLFGYDKAWNKATEEAAPATNTPPVARELENKILSKYFNRIPRSYACEPFALGQEISGAREALNKLLPPGKAIRHIQWSGDTQPFEAAIKAAREASMYNLNGGDVRYDAEYPSLSYVAPIGAQVGVERQIYSGNGNENTYKRPGEDRYAGYLYLQNMVRLTDSPWRIAPFNLYFHAHAGEDEMGLNALKQNIAFVRQQKNLIPVKTSEYAAMANGFYSTQIVALEPQSWQIKNIGALRTLRIDNASQKAVDFERSKGVLGQKYYMGSLYISLLAGIDGVQIALKNIHTLGGYPVDKEPYLIDSTWDIKSLQKSKNTLNITAQGYGSGIMRWHVPFAGKYTVDIHRNGKVLERLVADVGEDRILSMELAQSATELLGVSIHYPTK